MAKILPITVETSQHLNGNRQQLPASHKQVHAVSVTKDWTPGAISAGSASTKNIPVVQTVATGDFCLAAYSQPLAAGLELKAQPVLSTTSIAHSANALTAVATVASHGLDVGDWVKIDGATTPEYNGVHKITAKDTNTFTFAVPKDTSTVTDTDGKLNLVKVSITNLSSGSLTPTAGQVSVLTF